MRGLVGNMAVSCMRNASGHNYRNSSFIVDVDMGQYHVLQNTFLVIFNSTASLILLRWTISFVFCSTGTMSS